MRRTTFTVRAEPAPRANGHAAIQMPLLDAGRPVSSYAMPWGKHKGLSITMVPQDYLRWCLGNAANLSDELRAEIEVQLNLPPGSTRTAPEEQIRKLRVELERAKLDAKVAQESLKSEMDSHKRTARRWREAEARISTLIGAPGAAVSGNPKVEALRGIVKKWYRGLSMRFHPDRGGSNEQAIVVNEAYRALMTEVEQWERS